MKVKEVLMDFAYFILMMVLVSYGLLLVARGYMALGLSRLKRSPTPRS
ncbi:MAG: hypothetical protein ACE5HJ_00695 [Thermoplasmata archaeon]